MRLAGRTLTMVNAAPFRATLQPLQFGVGAAGGAEQVIHSTRLAAEQQPGWIVFQSDFQNAFNTIFRRLILEQLLNWGTKTWSRTSSVATVMQLSLVFALRMEQHIGLYLGKGYARRPTIGRFFFAVGLQAVLTALHEEMKKPDAVDAVLADYQLGDAGPLCELCTDDNQQSPVVDIAALLDGVRWWGPRPLLSLLPNA